MTFAEFELLESEPGKDELLNGGYFHFPPAFHRRVVIAHRLFALLLRAVDGGEPNRVYMATGYKIGPTNWLVPDVSVTHCDQVFAQYAEGSPEIAIEVVSDANSERQIDRKRRIYLNSGAREVWVFFPSEQAAWVFTRETSENFSGEFRSRVLPNFRIDLQKLFE
jgi:Uma2 family endonuclease